MKQTLSLAAVLGEGVVSQRYAVVETAPTQPHRSAEQLNYKANCYQTLQLC